MHHDASYDAQCISLTDTPLLVPDRIEAPMRRGLSCFALMSLAAAGCGDGSSPAGAPPGGAGAAAGSAGAPSLSGATSGGARGGEATPAGSGSGGGASGAAGSAGSGQGEPEPGKLSDCELAFPYREQAPRGHWLGADSNFSVVLSPSRALMTFQDTFVGGTDTASRAGSQMVANTLASIRCDQGAYSIDYFWGGSDRTHEAVFDDGNPDGHRLWIHRPFLHEGRMFLTATRVSSDDQGFEEHGMTLARVDNPRDAPETWRVEYFNLTDQRLTVGKGIADLGQHIYLFTPYPFEAILVRIEKARLLEDAISEASLEYLTSEGTWAPGLAPAQARKLGLPANTGLTLRFHEASRRWLALFTSTSSWPSARVAFSSAEQLEGPWTEEEELYRVPEMDPQAPEYEVDTFCYGASEHDAFNAEPDRQIVFTYTCNSNQFSKLVSDMAIYVPRVVKLSHPLAP